MDIPNDRRKRQRMQREAAKTYDTAHECFVEIQMNGRVAKVVPSLNARDILEVKVDNDSLTAVLDIISDELDTTEEEPPPDNASGSTDDVPDGFSVYTNAFRCTALFQSVSNLAHLPTTKVSVYVYYMFMLFRMADCPCHGGAVNHRPVEKCYVVKTPEGKYRRCKTIEDAVGFCQSSSSASPSCSGESPSSSK